MKAKAIRTEFSAGLTEANPLNERLKSLLLIELAAQLAESNELHQTENIALARVLEVQVKSLEIQTEMVETLRELHRIATQPVEHSRGYEAALERVQDAEERRASGQTIREQAGFTEERKA